jgi:aspartate/methionine/tyrosine aminotransferase
MPPGPVQAASAVAYRDDVHVDEQRARYRDRLSRLQAILAQGFDIDAPLPAGAFYLWAPAPGGDAWGLAKRLASDAGVLSSPGEFYGPAGAEHVRLAVVQPDDRLDLVAKRVGLT